MPSKASVVALTAVACVRVCGGHASKQADKLRSLVNSKFRTVIIELEKGFKATSMFYNHKGKGQ